MSAPRDKFGRPIVVVTGMGVVTSLGAGKTDNWTQIDRGRIRHPDRDAVPDRWVEIDHGRDGRFRHGRPLLVDRPHRAAGRNGNRGSARTGRHRRKGRFSRAAVPCGGAGGGRVAAAARARARRRKDRSPTTATCCASAAAAGSHNTIAVSCSVRWRAIWPKHSAPRARRSRSRPPAPPARPRSSLASRRSAAAKPTPRCAWGPTVRSIRKRWCGSRCCQPCRRKTLRRRPPQSRSRRTAMDS